MPLIVFAIAWWDSIWYPSGIVHDGLLNAALVPNATLISINGGQHNGLPEFEQHRQELRKTFARQDYQ